MVRTSIPEALALRALLGELKLSDVRLLELQGGTYLVWLGVELDASRSSSLAIAGACLGLLVSLVLGSVLDLVSPTWGMALGVALAWVGFKALRHTLSLARSLVLCRVACRRKDAAAARLSDDGRYMVGG